MSHDDAGVCSKDEAGHGKAGVLIRRGRREDEPFIREFTRDTFEWGDYVGDAFPEWLDEPGEVFVAEFCGRPVGVTHVFYLSSSEAWFEGIRIHPALRRKGIGSLLSRASIDAARTHGCRIARCAIDSLNTASSELARRLGFRLTAKLREFTRSLTWASLSEELGDEQGADGSGPEWGPAILVRQAREDELSFILSKAVNGARYLGVDFRWRALSTEGIRGVITSGNLLVATDTRGAVTAGALFSRVWEEQTSSGRVSIEIETSPVFGSQAGFKALFRHAVFLLRQKALLCGPNRDAAASRPGSGVPEGARPEDPSGIGNAPADEKGPAGLTFKIHSFCEDLSPVQLILLDLGFRPETPCYQELPGPQSTCRDFDVGLWELDL